MYRSVKTRPHCSCSCPHQEYIQHCQPSRCNSQSMCSTGPRHVFALGQNLPA